MSSPRTYHLLLAFHAIGRNEVLAPSLLARNIERLAKFVCADQRNLSQQRATNNPDELLSLAISLKETDGRLAIKPIQLLEASSVSQWDSIPALLTAMILTARKLLLLSKLGT